MISSNSLTSRSNASHEPVELESFPLLPGEDSEGEDSPRRSASYCERVGSAASHCFTSLVQFGANAAMSGISSGVGLIATIFTELALDSRGSMHEDGRTLREERIINGWYVGTTLGTVAGVVTTRRTSDLQLGAGVATVVAVSTGVAAYIGQMILSPLDSYYR